MGKVSTVQFVVEGEFITEFFREKVLVGQWRDGLNGLMESLHGMTYDYAMQILKGEKKLIGQNNDVQLVDDHPEKYLKDLEYQFDALYQENGKYYLPYAYVTDYGRRDLLDFNNGTFSKASEYKDYTPRALHYADNKFSDLSKLCSSKVARRLRVDYSDGVNVLFKIAVDPPPFVRATRSVDESINKYLDDGHYLDARGYLLWYGEDPIEQESLKVTEKFDKSATKSYKKRKKSEDERIHKEEERLKKYAELIKEQAGDDYIDVELKTKGTYRVPRAPFLWWVFNRSHNLKGTITSLPHWDPVCPSGLKMYGDDSYHSDWMLGAGISFDEWRVDFVLNEEFYHYMWDLQTKELNLKYGVLVASKKFAMGTIVHPKKGDKCAKDQIAVIPNAGVSWFDTVKDAAGVIVENGGSMSHLAVVGLEHGMLVVRVENARKKFLPGQTAVIDLKNNDIKT